MRVLVICADGERLDFVGRWLAGQGHRVMAVSGDLAVQARRLGADYVLRPGARWLLGF